jgi:hypothetical protein
MARLGFPMNANDFTTTEAESVRDSGLPREMIFKFLDPAAWSAQLPDGALGIGKWATCAE